jgi:hypothetical protein
MVVVWFSSLFWEHFFTPPSLLDTKLQLQSLTLPKLGKLAYKQSAVQKSLSFVFSHELAMR